MDNRLALYERISLAGGSTLFPGTQARIQRDIRALYRDRVVQVSWLAPGQCIELTLPALPLSGKGRTGGSQEPLLRACSGLHVLAAC